MPSPRYFRFLPIILLLCFVVFVKWAKESIPGQYQLDNELIKAVSAGYPKTVKILLENGADPNSVLWVDVHDITNGIKEEYQEPQKALDLALMSVNSFNKDKYSEIIWLLIENGADIKSPRASRHGVPNSLLFWAIGFNLNDDIVIYLIENGADIYTDDLASQAKSKGRDNIVKLLNDKGVIEKGITVHEYISEEDRMLNQERKRAKEQGVITPEYAKTLEEIRQDAKRRRQQNSQK